MHRFMSVVTDLCYKSKGTTVLYIPNENLNDPELASKDKELVQRLESILIYWTK